MFSKNIVYASTLDALVPSLNYELEYAGKGLRIKDGNDLQNKWGILKSIAQNENTPLATKIRAIPNFTHDPQFESRLAKSNSTEQKSTFMNLIARNLYDDTKSEELKVDSMLRITEAARRKRSEFEDARPDGNSGFYSDLKATVMETKGANQIISEDLKINNRYDTPNETRKKYILNQVDSLFKAGETVPKVVVNPSDSKTPFYKSVLSQFGARVPYDNQDEFQTQFITPDVEYKLGKLDTRGWTTWKGRKVPSFVALDFRANDAQNNAKINDAITSEYETQKIRRDPLASSFAEKTINYKDINLLD